MDIPPPSYCEATNQHASLGGSLTFMDFIPEIVEESFIPETEEEGFISSKYEPFGNLLERANIWLQENPNYEVKTCESVEFKSSKRIVSSEKMTYTQYGEIRTSYMRCLRFPVSKERRDLWIRAVRRKNWQPSASSGICSQHFRPEDFDLTGQTRRLREGTVPSVFPLYRSYLQKTPSKLLTRKSKTSDVEQKTEELCKMSENESCVTNNISVITSECSANDNSEPLTPRKRKMKQHLDEKCEQLCNAKKRIMLLHQKLRRQQVKIKSDKEIIEFLVQKNLILESSAEILKNSLPSDVCCLLTKASENAKTQRSKPGKSYDPSLRSFALSLHYFSPKAYDFL